MIVNFSTFIPFYENCNPNIRYFAHTNKGKKELKHFQGNIYYFCIDRKRIYVKVSGGLYNKKYELLKENEND